MNKPTRVLLIDDHAVLRSGLRLLLEKEKDITVIGEAADGAQGVKHALELRPDVVLMDITLPDLDGVEATRRITDAWHEARVLALTMHAEEAYLVQFLDAGGVGYVRKSAADRDLIQAIRQVAGGRPFLQPDGVMTIVQQHHNSDKSAPPGLEVLSEREQQVLELTAKGFTSGEIGDRLGLSPRTIETYRERIMQKLNLEHRSQLVEYALHYHLLG